MARPCVDVKKAVLKSIIQAVEENWTFPTVAAMFEKVAVEWAKVEYPVSPVLLKGRAVRYKLKWKTKGLRGRPKR